MRVTTFLATLFTVLSTISPANAQTTSGPGDRQRNPADRPVQKWFEESGLKVGDPFPAVEIFDAAGKPFNTKSLKGQYTVVVNGCLT